MLLADGDVQGGGGDPIVRTVEWMNQRDTEKLERARVLALQRMAWENLVLVRT